MLRASEVAEKQHLFSFAYLLAAHHILQHTDTLIFPTNNKKHEKAKWLEYSSIHLKYTRLVWNVQTERGGESESMHENGEHKSKSQYFIVIMWTEYYIK